MALEGKMSAVPPQLFTADGSAQGIVTIADTAGFRSKQTAWLKNSAYPNGFAVQVMRVLSTTKLIVGDIKANISRWAPLDISAFTVASGAFIGAEENNKNNIPWEDHYRAVYESDPVVADRVVQVDKYGNFYDKNNPMPIIFDGTVSIGEVEIIGTNGNTLEPNTDGSIKTVQLFTKPFDAITATYPSSTQEIYQSRVGGIAGAVQETVTINYTDTTKNLILNVART